MKLILFDLLVYLLLSITLLAGDLKISKIEPPNWWSGMKKSEIQLMVYGENLSDVSVKSESNLLEIISVEKSDTPAYCFVNIQLLPEIKAGAYKLIFSNENSVQNVEYKILSRVQDTNRFKGFDQSDVIYLVTPDRFADGNSENNTVEGFKNEYNRNKPYGRHGGDIEGIINKLDYLKELGVTAIWINPLVENNTRISYHGYAATDFYNIDPRFGSNELYKQLVNEAHSKGLKVILDHVSNHMSIDHPWMKNLPYPDWINGSIEKHINARHDKMAYFDPYASDITIDYLSKGWFVDSMPDLNQRNEFVANYIVQNTIWWIEYSGIDGIREDTYPYIDQEFIAEWAGQIMAEYPEFNIVGEVWTGTTAFLAPYQGNSKLREKFNSNLPAVTDFGLRDALSGYLKGQNGLYEIYKVLAEDYLYADPSNLVTFIDNHDIERVLYASDRNWAKAKTALTILLTTRGIPQILYGTEIGMVGAPEHGLLRADFPGGFPDDDRNAFTEEGRTELERQIYDFIKKLLHVRKSIPCLQTGKLTHFPPSNNVYVFTRQIEGEKVIVLVNGAERSVTINTNEYGSLFDSEEFDELITDQNISIEDELELNAYDVKVLMEVP